MAPLKFCFVISCLWSMFFVSEVWSAVNVSTTECKDVKKGEIVVDACVKIEKVTGQGKDYTYDTLESACEVNGSRLVTLKSKVKRESVVGVMKKNYGCDNYECRFWIGLQYNTLDGVWMWSDGTNINQRETPMERGSAGKCVAMNVKQTDRFVVQTCKVSLMSTHVICEWSLSDPAPPLHPTTTTTAVATSETTAVTKTKTIAASTIKTTAATTIIGSASITISPPASPPSSPPSEEIPLIVWIFIGINVYCIPSNIVLGSIAYVVWKRRQRNKKAASANADVETGKGGKTSKRVAVV